MTAARTTPTRTAAVIAALLSVASPLSAQDGGEAGRPNVIFFLSDDQRHDFMGCAGHRILQTPTMDHLASGGIRFANTFVTTSICAASRASIFTGLYERTHRFTFRTPPIAARFTARSYPALLRAAGYRTGFIGKFGVGVEKGERERMFDFMKPLSRNPYFRKAPDGSRRHISEIAGDLAIEFLRSCEADRTFCLSVSFNAPHAEDSDKKNHYPWPEAVDGLYRDDVIPPPRLLDAWRDQPWFLQTSLNIQRWFWRWDTPEKYQRNVRGYYRMISGIDRVMGRVLDELQRLGRAGDTVVIFSSDNGYYRGDRGFAGKWSHYEESLRVPLIIFDPRAPASRRGLVSRTMALNVDIPATILALAGVEMPQTYQGRSLVPILEGQEPESWRDDFFCEHLMEHTGIPKWEGVRGRRWVYARYFEHGYEFLHDLETDPNQLRNLARDGAHGETLAALRARCDALRSLYEMKNGPLPAPAPGEAPNQEKR